jgi:acyl-CoA reductase-like NAD-dependent aldehyde dehydrogenase
MNKVLSPEVSAGKLYSGGWRVAGLGTVEVVDKATGAGIGAIGVASAHDVAVAAAAAHEAQTAWAQVPGPQRGGSRSAWSASSRRATHPYRCLLVPSGRC